MPVVFLDGDELDNRSKRLVLKAVGPITFKCKSCGGGFVDLKNIFVTSESTIVSYLYWCNVCHQMYRSVENYPSEWHGRLIARTKE